MKVPLDLHTRYILRKRILCGWRNRQKVEGNWIYHFERGEGVVNTRHHLAGTKACTRFEVKHPVYGTYIFYYWEVK